MTDLHSGTTSLPTLLAHRRLVLLIFVDPDCTACHTLLPLIAAWRQNIAAYFTIVLISRGTSDTTRATFGDEHRPLLLDPAGSVAEAYDVPGSPSAVLVQPDGTIASSLAAGATEVRALVDQTVYTIMHSPNSLDAPDAMNATQQPIELHNHAR